MVSWPYRTSSLKDGADVHSLDTVTREVSTEGGQMTGIAAGSNHVHRSYSLLHVLAGVQQGG